MLQFSKQFGIRHGRGPVLRLVPGAAPLVTEAPGERAGSRYRVRKSATTTAIPIPTTVRRAACPEIDRPNRAPV